MTFVVKSIRSSNSIGHSERAQITNTTDAYGRLRRHLQSLPFWKTTRSPFGSVASQDTPTSSAVPMETLHSTQKTSGQKDGQWTTSEALQGRSIGRGPSHEQARGFQEVLTFRLRRSQSKIAYSETFGVDQQNRRVSGEHRSTVPDRSTVRPRLKQTAEDLP